MRRFFRLLLKGGRRSGHKFNLFTESGAMGADYSGDS